MFSRPGRLLLLNLLQEKRWTCHAASKRITLQSHKSVCVGFALKGNGIACDVLPGGLRKDDRDGNKNVKKTLGLDW